MTLMALFEQKGMTQVDVSKKSGIKCPAISRWINGVAMPSLTNCAALANALGCSFIEVTNAALETHKLYQKGRTTDGQPEQDPSCSD